jgi:hypothetical protein
MHPALPRLTQRPNPAGLDPVFCITDPHLSPAPSPHTGQKPPRALGGLGGEAATPPFRDDAGVAPRAAGPRYPQKEKLPVNGTPVRSRA